MEIESKFTVPDAQMAKQLHALNQFGDFVLQTPTTLTMRDTFFDTRANDLLNTRHVLRVRRRSDGRVLLTFKAPAQKKAAIHRRPETEVELSVSQTPRRLHVGELPLRIKKLVSPLVHEDVLLPMFSISQTREIRMLKHARRTIAEWSLDQVNFRAGKRKQSFYELEVELKKTGTEEELETISTWLATAYSLAPQSESKFGRALQFMRGN